MWLNLEDATSFLELPQSNVCAQQMKQTELFIRKSFGEQNWREVLHISTGLAQK
jgi:hypothetical protein